MSHLGMKILYGILNDLPYAVCERVCMPWVDMILRAPGQRDVPVFPGKPYAAQLLWTSSALRSSMK